MKKLFVIAIATITVFLLQPQLSFAQMGMMGNYNNSSLSAQSVQGQQKALDDVTNALLNSQKVSSINQLNCSKISQDEFEKVGDAWMGVMAGSEKNHSFMEQRMGGEGSQTLKQAHIQMGENYLGCQANGSYSWMPMMFGIQNNTVRGGGSPMMGWGDYGYNGIMGWNGGFGVLGFVFYIVVLIDLILLGVLLWKKIKR